MESLGNDFRSVRASIEQADIRYVESDIELARTFLEIACFEHKQNQGKVAAKNLAQARRAIAAARERLSRIVTQKEHERLALKFIEVEEAIRQTEFDFQQ